ncbi:filamentous hemagglutinin family protein [Bradyrhizobium diazoefficiens]|uniref:filamentous haemagglutinin family protein n=1 Tax=Bradyrhizobium diazoefficiens TaxID=1355477 RepID=UPI00190956F6|nr:filamentous haemagglutinin family protein [Bradyrhizobium diazoefficiens]QQO17699.1 filamentous hemagglutinin family protein [Bradyrhizobium diazoefficiens]
MTIDRKPSAFSLRWRSIRAALLTSTAILPGLISHQAQARSLTPGNSSVAPATAAQLAAGQAAQQAAAAGAQAQVSLARAAAAFTAARQAQQDAAAAAQALKSTFNGVTTGGLMPLGGVKDVTAQSACGNSCSSLQLNTPASWQNASTTFTQTVKDGQYKVDITQTQQKAILNWETFNIGRNTSVKFEQQSADWTVLNRVTDPTGSPTQILGQMSALGGVYVINRNGIIFGAGAQVNVHALVASSLDVGALGMTQSARDNFFLGTGINGPNAFSVAPTRPPQVPGAPDDGGYALENNSWGDVKVQAGASIKTSTVDLDSPGFIYLFGRNVSNAGTLSSPAGEVAMVAARSISLVSGGFWKLPSAVLPSGVTYRGTDFQITQFSDVYLAGEYKDGGGLAITNNYAAGTGLISNDGLIETPRGITQMNGDRITIGKTGVISADTGITRNSMVLLRAATSVDLEGTISSLPYDDPLTSSLPQGGGTGSTVQSFAPAYVELSAQTSVTVGSSGLISAPSATVALRAIDLGTGLNASSLYTNTTTALFGTPGAALGLGASVTGPQQVLLEDGATVDVAGLQNVLLPASYNFIPFKPIGLPFADMPLQRGGALDGQTLWIDIRASGTRSDGTTWVGTPVADASGTISNYGRSIQQLMTSGGAVSLQTDRNAIDGVTPSRSVITQSGSVINVAGGNVTYLPGIVSTSVLLGADGRRYSMTNADPNMTYVGLAGTFTVDHSRWRVKEVWSTATQTYQPGYTEGHDAGGINITSVSPQLQGQMYFGSAAGERQISLGLKPSATNGVTATQAKADELPSQGYLTLNLASSVVIGSSPDSTSGGLGVTNQTKHIANVPDPPEFAPVVKGADFTPTSAYQTILSAETLSSYGLSLLKINSNDLLVTRNSANDAAGLPDLNFAAGGTFSATTGGAISVAGNIKAAGGQISLVTDGYAFANAANTGALFQRAQTASGKDDIVVEGTLDVSGRWVNDTGQRGTEMGGPGYIDGGSISIATNNNSNLINGADTTGSILLAQGSLLDASSGGYISSTGTAKTASTGVMAGRGGSISLTTYQRGAAWRDPNGGSGPERPTTGTTAQIQLDGTLRAYGFERNGTLTLGAAKTITIDSTAHADASSGIVTATSTGLAPVTLAASRLTGGGFGAYVIESTPDGWTGTKAAITVAAGVNLTLQQQNLSSIADYSKVGTGSKIADVASRARLPDDQRKAVDLTLKSDNILLDTGAVITTDPQAKISLGGIPIYTTSDPIREQAAQNVLLRGSIIDHGGTVVVNAQKTWLASQAKVDVSGTFVANSRFGQPKGQLVSGTVLTGGTFTIEAATPNVQAGTLANTYTPGAVPSGTYVVAEQGAVVDVSGYATSIQAQDGHGGAVTVQSWSDAGTVKVDAAAFVWGGTFEARGGRSADGTQVMSADGKTPLANGGTLMLGGAAMLLQQDSANVTAALAGTLAGGPATLANLAGNANSLVDQLASASGTSSSIFAAVDRLSAFENVLLYSGTAQNGAARIFTGVSGSTYGIAAPTLNPLSISGSVTWTSNDGLSRLYVAASSISSTQSGSTVTLAAPYMLLTGGGGSSSTAGSSLHLGFERTKAGDPTSDVIIARTIDVENAAFAGFNDIQLRSSGDIRLSTPKVANGLATSTDAPRFSGQIVAGGANLILDAQRIYPVSDVDFTIQTTGNVTFQATAGGRSDIPLSAGGSLSVYAATIDQNGNIFAPLGRITLGDDGTATGNTSKIPTTSVTLAPGSLTSVTLAGTVVPYGETIDGVNWYYNASLHPLLAAANGTEPVLPSKGLVLNASGVAVKKGATIDTRGGGDLQAAEWIQGKGGSRDTLATTPSGQTVYALVPSSNDPVAAHDIHFTTARSLDAGQTVKAGDAYPLAGQQIYLNGSTGVPAGTYTLYPGHYATLPGALRVVDYGSNLGRNIPSGTTLPDGTVLVTGHYAQSVRPGAYSSGSELFAIQTGAVWKQYSEYSFNSANSYFTDKANHDGVAIPRLPVDAGRIAIVAQQQLLLAATELNAPATDGRGGELDVSVSKLAVVSPSVNAQTYANAGYVVVASDQLSSFESVLIGGLRSDTAKGTLITGTASELVVDTPVDPSTQTGGLLLPEIMLVTQSGTTTQQTVSSSFQVNISGTWFDGTSQFTTNAPTATGTISIATGSVIRTSGSVHTGAGRNFYVGSNPGGYTTAQQVATALGGTLDSTGTVITGADINKIPVSIPGVYGSNPSTTVLSNYYSQGLGGLLVASQDSTISIAGPSGSPLTIQFTSLAGSLPVRGADGSGGPATVTLPGGNVGRIEIGAGAQITTNNLFMQATASKDSIVLNKSVTGNSNAPAAVITANQATIAGGSIGIGASSRDSVILSQTNLDQLAGVKNLKLAAVAGDITFYGTNLIQTAMQGLTLDARAVTGTGGNSRIEVGGTVTLVNTSGATGTSAQAGVGGSLSIAATDVVFGGGSQTIAGFSQVNLAASDQVLFKNQGALTLGTGADVVGLQIVTPLVSVGGNTSKGGGSFVVATSGAVNIGEAIVGDPGSPPVRANAPKDKADTGGSLLVKGGSVNVGGFADDQGKQRSGSVIQAQSGSITLEATTGDVTLDHNAYLSARGYAKNLIDTTTYLPGGKIVLKADLGNVVTRGASASAKGSDASVIDVAQPDGGMGYGGQVQILATAGQATVLGDLRGKGGNGLGGGLLIDANRLQVDSQGFTPRVALDPLADKLLAGGFTGAVDIHTRTGDLILSEGHTLKANSVTLTADDQTWNGSDPTQQFGRIVVAGTIDASGYAGKTADGTGQAGGKVNLYAANEIDLLTTGVINASTEHSDERGGDVTIAIGWGAKSNAGIDLQPGSRIDVHGGTKGGLSGGTVLVRAPNDGGNDVYITEIGSTITGARDVTIESFVSFSTNGQGGIDASSLGWNGVLDPGGSVAKTSLKVNTVYVPPGSGGSYTQVPDVIFSAPAMSATGLKSISIASTSSWFHLDPNFVGEVVIEAPAGGRAASGTVTTDANGVPTFTITNAGSGFTGAPATIRFYSQGVLVSTAHLTSSDFASAQLTTTANQAQGTAVMGLKSISIASTSGWYHLDPNFSGNVVIQSASGGASATGTVTTDANGVPTFTITGAGSGFTGAPSTILFYQGGKLILTGHLTANDFASTVMTVVGVNVTNAGAGYAVGSSATLSFSGGGAGATQAASVSADMDTAEATGSGAFANVTLRQYVQGNLTYNTSTEVKHFGFSGAMDRVVKPLADRLGSMVHLRPGVELVSPDPTINGGNITVASNWNLAAGTVGKLTTDNKFDPSTSYVDFVYRYLANYGSVDAPKYGVEAGALTLRALNNINVNASISDGFFQFGDYLNATYKGDVRTYLAKPPARTIDGNNLNNYLPAPIAPYKTTGNVISPTALDLNEADLFPHMLNVCVSHCGDADSAPHDPIAITNPGSWSYRLTAGADMGSANPNAMQPLASVSGRGAGDVIVNNHVPATDIAADLNLPTMVRTGTGSISIAAARDVSFADTVAPGVIYAAGVNTARYANPYDASGKVTDVNGFLEPQLLSYGSPKQGNVEVVYGAPTAAAFPVAAGDVSVVAQQDIKGYRNVTTTNPLTKTAVLWNAYYTPWLISHAGATDSAGAPTLGAGVFAPASGSIGSQTAWWIQYASFREGILSAGGNVNVVAGRDLVDVSVSLPTTGRVTGGLGALSTPQTQLYGSGNMTVRAGRNLLGGSYYEGSGHASIQVSGIVDAKGTITLRDLTTAPNYTLLAVDTGQISMIAGGSMAIGGVVNPAQLHVQSPTQSNPAGKGAGLLMNTYGPDSAVNLVAITGNLNIAMPQTFGTTPWRNPGLTYPASFTAIAAGGDITTNGLVTNSSTLNPGLPGIVLTGSQNGTFELLAQGSIDLTGGYTNLSTIAPSISAGPSLLDTAFDPYQPNNGMTGASSSALLAHRDDHDTNPARIYAVSGDVSAVATMTSFIPTGAITSATPIDYSRIELNRPAKIYAGRDILNLNLIAQNVAADDVTTIQAGRDILYNYVPAFATGTLPTGLTQPSIWGGTRRSLGGPGLQIAGSGFLVVQAGRDLGPFLPATRDNNAYTQDQEGIASIGNASLWPIGNRYVGLGSSGTYDVTLLGPANAIAKKRNEQLPGTGADIITMFGVANGINYDGYSTVDQATNQSVYHPGVIGTYIDPANASRVDHNYISELKDFLVNIGRPAGSDAEAWSIFQALPKDLQHVFADKVFFAELKAVGKAQSATSGNYQRGYEAINTMFPSDFGYTKNTLGGGTNGANALKHTGDLDLLHATIQTRLGGDVSIFGPGGTIRVGSLAIEPNPLLKPNDLGILTLGRGDINTFTDTSVLVNSSRVMTQQGGDILMWSSNGDLDAGRGAQTTLSFPPLAVVFNSDDYQSVDLGGLVSGAGIAVVQSSKLASKSNAYLLAPRGTVDAGEAGIRVSGNLTIAAVQVVNAGNIQVGGTATGIPTVTAPNIGALSAASNTAGAAAKSAEPPTAGGNNDRASVFIVEVVGYGGGDSGGRDSGSSGNGQGSKSDSKSDDQERKQP